MSADVDHEVVADEVTSDAAETNDTPSDADEVTSADSAEGSTDEAVEDSSDEKAAEPCDEDELTDS